MRLQVKQTGGFAGLTRTASLDTACRPDADRWHALAEKALANGSPAPVQGTPDGFRYAITIDGRTVHFADPDVPEAVAELVSATLRAARA
ncbi:protealysin inhibitor emfourin [Streptomyces capparidis]